MDTPARIKPLESSVVNRIAAGEIIIGPSNALKEIMENSIDAKSTSIDILVKEGGLKLLQITDNGTGIDKDDLGILCERFTTSKLQKFEDLNSIATYGFRGEALASISHIAHLSVTTKTRDSPCAWRCLYIDGALVPLKPKGPAEPKAVAGKDGTQITVEDLFYNVPSRLRSLRSGNEEFAKIVDVIGRYAVHTEGVGFSCKKLGDSYSALSTRAGISRKERIRTVFGSAVANELIEVDIGSNDDIGLLNCYGQVSNSNYLNKKVIQPVFFINNRLVSCDPLKRAINLLYTIFLPKGNKPFIYLALEIDPLNVDVNVHPTKREVRFLHEEEIIEYIVTKLQESLTTLDSSRNFLTQQVLPNAKRLRSEEEDFKFSSPNQQNKAKIYAHNLVRTDASQAKITSFVTTKREAPKQNRSIDIDNEASDEIENLVDSVEKVEGPTSKRDNETESHEPEEEEEEEEEEEGEEGEEEEKEDDEKSIDETQPERRSKVRHVMTNRERVNVKLSSILSLREEVESQTHKELTEIFAKHTFVGVVDQQRRLAAIQFDVKLYLVDYAAALYELFYQIGLSDFGNFGRIHLNEAGISIRILLQSVYDNEEFMKSYLDSLKSIDDVLQVFVDMNEMLQEYFAIEVNVEDEKDPKLVCVPLLLQGYVPPMSKLGVFLFRLGNKINWSDETECLDGVLKQIALLYIPESSSDPKDEQSVQIFENILFPTIKRRLLAPRHLTRDVVEIANLPGLYRVFERC